MNRLRLLCFSVLSALSVGTPAGLSSASAAERLGNATFTGSVDLSGVTNKSTVRSDLGANDAGNLTTGTLNNARLSAQVLLSSGTYSDPSWLTLDFAHVASTPTTLSGYGVTAVPSALLTDPGSATSLSLSHLTPTFAGLGATPLDATKLSGALPALNGASLTSLSAGNLTGALPAISGASLTSLNPLVLTNPGSLSTLNESNLFITLGGLTVNSYATTNGLVSNDRLIATTLGNNHLLGSSGSDNVIEIWNSVLFSAICGDRCVRNANLTFASNPANATTVTVGGKTYTFQTTLTNSDGHVLIGANLAASISNLAAAINLASGSGSTYAAATTAGPVWAIAGTSNLLVWDRSTNTGTVSTTTSTTVSGASWNGALSMTANGVLHDGDGCWALGIGNNGDGNDDFRGVYLSTNATQFDIGGNAAFASLYPEPIGLFQQVGPSANKHRRIFIDSPIRGGDYSIYCYGWTDAVTGGDDVRMGPLGWKVGPDGKMTIGTLLHLTPGAAPGTPSEGDVYANSGDHHLYFYNGTAWKQLDN